MFARACQIVIAEKERERTIAPPYRVMDAYDKIE